jgi:hypothetical protein
MLHPSVVIRMSLLTAALVLFPVVLHACPGCWSASPTDSNTLGGGWLWSFLVLLSMPAAIVGSIGGWIFRQSRRAARTTAEQRFSDTAREDRK